MDIGNKELQAPSGATIEGMEPRGGPTPWGRLGRRVGQSSASLALAVFLIVEVLFFIVATPYFWHVQNIINMLTTIAVTGIVAAPGTLLIVGGQIDLSVGSGAGLVSVMLGYFAPQIGLPLAIILAVAIGLLAGATNGFIVSVIGVNSLITTLGTLAAYYGIAEVLSNGQTITINSFGGLATARPFLDLPIPVLLMFATLLLFWALMTYTTYGRSMYAVGGNPVAARLVGIPIRRVTFMAFVLSAAAFTLGGFVLSSQLSAGSPTFGVNLELAVITAVILGGASLSGGRGTIVGTVLGLLIIGVLGNGLVLMNVNSFWQDVANGVLLIAAVSFDRLRLRLTGREQ
jgi:ribose transport system permease protein